MHLQLSTSYIVLYFASMDSLEDQILLLYSNSPISVADDMFPRLCSLYKTDGSTFIDRRSKLYHT